MQKEIVHDALFLARKAEPADKSDLKTIQDLRDTLAANRFRCVGMAANMIGVNKAIVAICPKTTITLLINPVLKAKEQPYTTEEGCLCHEGTRRTTRYKRIRVQYLDEKFKSHTEWFTGETAQILQHEMDHLQGILI